VAPNGWPCSASMTDREERIGQTGNHSRNSRTCVESHDSRTLLARHQIRDHLIEASDSARSSPSKASLNTKSGPRGLSASCPNRLLYEPTGSVSGDLEAAQQPIVVVAVPASRD
jgi:hypothetical protein